jgi:hypothetical protein
MMKKVSLYDCILRLVFVIASCMFSSSASAETFIVKDGLAQAEIIISENPPRAVKLAVAELQVYIEKISGAKLAVANLTNSAIPVKIYVGKSKYTDELKLSDEGLKYGAFKMVSGDKWLALLGQDKDYKESPTYIKAKDGRPFYYEEWDALTGGKWGNPMDWPGSYYSNLLKISDFDDRGSLNAIYEFLRMQGVRWYMPGELGEIVPACKSIAFENLDKTVRPDYAYRNCGIYSPNFASGSKDALLWRLRIGLGQAPELLGIASGPHGLTKVHVRDKSHPEYFALFNGKRSIDEPYGWGTPCLSSKGFFESTVNFCRAYFKVYPDDPAISIQPGDSTTIICQCELCKGKDTPERGYQGLMSDYVWDFVNRVGIELQKTNPDKKIICEAYGPYWLPPSKIDKLSPNVMVMFFNGRQAFFDSKQHGIILDNRDAYLKKIAPGNFYTADFILSSRPKIDTAGLPIYFPHIIAEDLRSLKGKSVGDLIEVTYGYDSEGKDMYAPGFNNLNVYITARYYWDASQDIDALLNEYYEKFYGPAAKEMKAFVEFSEKNWPLMQSKLEVVDKAFELLTAASKAAGDTVYGKRINLMVQFVEPMKKLRDKLAIGRKGAKAEALEVKNANFKLDGKLDKPFWKDVREYELKEVVTGQPAVSRTTFKVVWSDMKLVFGIRCEEPDMKGLNIAATKGKDDFNLMNGDEIEILLETQTHSFYQIIVNPAGALVDIDRIKGLNTLWSSEAEVAAFVGDTFWSVEVRIPISDNDLGGADPLRNVEGKKPTAASPWYFNVCRQRMRDGKEIEDDAFSPTGKKSFCEPWMFGELIVK